MANLGQTSLNPPEVLLQPQTAPDGPATASKRNYPRMNLQHYLLKDVGRDVGVKNGAAPWRPEPLIRNRWPQYPPNHDGVTAVSQSVALPHILKATPIQCVNRLAGGRI
jgi:hypothetical protein